MSTCFLSFDIEDWFQVENLRGLYPPESWGQVPRRVNSSTRVILELLEKVNAKGTFFFVGWIAEREPQLVKDVQAAGHEIASHGYGHIIPTTMTMNDFREDAKRALGILQDLTGTSVAGYRAPCFNIDNGRLDILASLGFRFDSSYHPFRLHDRYGTFEVGPQLAPGVLQLANGMVEFPLTMAQWGPVLIPVSGGGYFRQYPGALFRSLFRMALGNLELGRSLYLHSWEFDPEHPRVQGVDFLSRFRHYNGLKKTLPRMRKFIRMLLNHGVQFSTMSRYLNDLPAGNDPVNSSGGAPA